MTADAPTTSHLRMRCKVCGLDIFPTSLLLHGMWLDEEYDEAVCLEGTPEIEEGARTGELDNNPFHSPELYWEPAN